MKKIILMFFTVLFILSCIPAMADTAYYEKIIYDEDFTDGTDIQLVPGGGTIDDSYTASDADGNQNDMLYIGGANDAHLKSYPAASENCVVEFDAYFPGSNNGVKIEIRGGATLSNFFLLNNTSVTMHNVSDSVSITSSYHHKVKIHMSFDTDTYEVYIDGSKITASPVALGADWSTISQLRVYRYKNSDYGLIDNYKVYTLVPGPSFVSHTGPVVYNAEKIDFTLNGNLMYDSLNTDSVVLSDSDGIVELSEINTDSAADKIISLYPKYNLNSNTTYTVTINQNACVFENVNIKTPVTYTFSTSPEPREISNVGWSSGSGSVTFSAELASLSEGNDICIILSLWDGSRLIGLKTQKYTYADITSDSHVVLDISGAASGNTVKAIAVSDFDNPQRVGKPLYQYTVE